MLSCHVSTDPSGGNNLSGAFTLTTRNNTEGTVIASFIWEYIYGFDPQSFVLLWKFDGAALDAEIWYKPKTTNQYLVLDVMSESGFNAPVYGTRVLTNLWAFFSNDPGVPDLPTGYTQVVSQLPTYDYNVRAAIQIADRIYEGEDLTARWASEIGGTRFNGNVAAWAQARIKAGDWRGIHVGDYIPITCKNNVKLNMRANINTYKNWGDVAIGNHIDWISLEYWPELIIYNLVDYNNGTTVSPYPWLSCYLYANLNGLKMLVPNSAIASPSMIEVDFTGRGIIDQLPDEWQAVIVQKRARLPQRYTAGALLTNDNNWGWSNAGKLWIPSEVERYGTEHWGSKNGFSGAANRQYQVFADTPELVRSNSWMMGSAGNDSRSVIVNGRNGGSDRLPASTMAPAVPICFRVA
jgi:hypothetical protein